MKTKAMSLTCVLTLVSVSYASQNIESYRKIFDGFQAEGVSVPQSQPAVFEFPERRSHILPFSNNNGNQIFYQRVGYASRQDAEVALKEAQENLKEAGFGVIAGHTIDLDFFQHGFRIDYLDDLEYPNRIIQTYRSPAAFRDQFSAQKAMEETKQNMRNLGRHVIVGQVLKTDFFHYYYEVDYVSGSGRNRIQVYTSPFYVRREHALRDMLRKTAQLQHQGHRIISRMVFEERINRRYFFKIRYYARRR